MSAPPILDVVNAVRARIAAECAPVGSLAVGIVAPITVAPTADLVCYALHVAPPEDRIKTAGAVIQRTHTIEIRLWMRTPGEAQEETFLAYADAISFAFFQYQTLGGIATRATLAPANGRAYIQIGGTIYRQRVWTLEVVQQFSVIMQ